MASRPIGRPRLDAATKRTVAVSLRFSPEEVKVIDQRADATGLRRAAFCRHVLLGTRIRTLVDMAVLRALGRIGNNLNQLAYHANATGRLQELHTLREVLAELRVKVREL